PMRLPPRSPAAERLHAPPSPPQSRRLLTPEQEHLPPRQDLTSLPSAMPMAAWLSLLSPPPSRRHSLPMPLPPPSPATEELHLSQIARQSCVVRTAAQDDFTPREEMNCYTAST